MKNVLERKRHFRTKSLYLKKFQRFENNNVSPHQSQNVLITITTLVLNLYICNNNLFYRIITINIIKVFYKKYVP